MDFLKFVVMTPTTPLLKPALRMSHLITSKYAGTATLVLYETLSRGLHQQVPQHGKFKRFFHHNSQDGPVIIPLVPTVKPSGSWEHCERASLLTRPALEDLMEGEHKHLDHPMGIEKSPFMPKDPGKETYGKWKAPSSPLL